MTVGTLVLVLSHALFLLALAFLWTHARYTDRLFKRLVERTIEPGMSEQERAVALLHRTHALLASREEVWGSWEGGIRPTPPLGLFRRSALQVLIEGGGCGSESLVLARALRVAGIEARMAQMKVNDRWGAHIFVTARVDGRWVVLDPLLDTAYRKADGTLASVEELRANWDAFRPQGPEWSNPAADFAAVRYTNWQKIPVVMPTLKRVLMVALGPDAVDELSISSYALSTYKALGVTVLLGYVPILGLTLARLARSRS